VALVVRTQRPFFRSRPGRLLVVLTAALVAAAFAIPFLPLAPLFGFVPLPASLLVTTCVIALAYVVATEAAKRRLYPAGPGPLTPSSREANIAAPQTL
jgi:Mg2+-importing ATPase